MPKFLTLTNLCPKVLTFSLSYTKVIKICLGYAIVIQFFPLCWFPSFCQTSTKFSRLCPTPIPKLSTSWHSYAPAFHFFPNLCWKFSLLPPLCQTYHIFHTFCPRYQLLPRLCPHYRIHFGHAKVMYFSPTYPAIFPLFFVLLKPSCFFLVMPMLSNFLWLMFYLWNLPQVTPHRPSPPHTLPHDARNVSFFLFNILFASSSSLFI